MNSQSKPKPGDTVVLKEVPPGFVDAFDNPIWPASPKLGRKSAGAFVSPLHITRDFGR